MRSRTHTADTKRRVGPSSTTGRHSAALIRARSSSAITELQQSVGNQAVRRILSRAGHAPVVQRDTKRVAQGKGLDTAKSHSTYAAHAVKLWTTNKTMTLTRFAEELMLAIGAELSKYGIPTPKMTPDPNIGGLGEFDSELWVIKVNIARFSKTVGATTLGQLSASEVEEAVGTLYHEARHADQDVLVVRSLLATKSPAKIVAETKIHKDVVAKVNATKYSDTLDAAKLAQSGRMYDIMYGEHNQLLTFLVKESRAVAAIVDLAKPGSNIAAARSHVQVFDNWQTKVLAPTLVKLGSKPKRSPMEDDLLRDLQRIDAAATTFLTSWRATSVAKSPHPDDIVLLREDAEKLESSIATAYRNLETEKDAFRVEDAVKAEFRSQAKAPARRKAPTRK